MGAGRSSNKHADRPLQAAPAAHQVFNHACSIATKPPLIAPPSGAWSPPPSASPTRPSWSAGCTTPATWSSALVAELDGAIVGHVLLSRMTAPFPALALAPVSVTPLHQNRGVGAALVRAALARAAAGEWRGVFVLGDPAYYGRFGFDVALATEFDSPFAGEHFMALGGALPTRRGHLQHAAAFFD